MGNCYGARVKHVSGASSARNSNGGLSKKNNAGKGQLERSPFQWRLQEDLTVPPGSDSVPGAPLYAFSYAALKAATRNFRPDSLLGEGGFGCVYKGHIDEQTFLPVHPGQGILIAVKKLNPEGLQGDKEWLAELYFLGALSHPNLVKLIGYCYEDQHRLLVYEFLPRGSLENHLFARGRHTISWSTRLKIAVDAAEGLTFLHDAPKPVIYRDFKSSNILLDSEFNAKLSDFGLAKDGPTGGKTHVTTRVMGTLGYAAPEYVATGRLTAKSDVYGFGVVLLEILTGRRALDNSKPGGERNLVEWALPYLLDERKWSRVLDQRLEGQYSLRGAQKAASIALQCLCQDPKLRPTMKEVLELLKPLVSPSKPNKSPTHDFHIDRKLEDKKHGLELIKQENNHVARSAPHALKLPPPER